MTNIIYYNYLSKLTASIYLFFIFEVINKKQSPMLHIWPILLVYMLNHSSPSTLVNDKFVLSNISTEKRIGATFFEKEGWKLIYPEIDFEKQEPLVFRFDIISDMIEGLDYSFVHCNSDWSPSGLSSYEITDGFPANRIEYATPSFNTKVNYVHYKIEFPQAENRFKVSGNYLILIHRPGEEDRPILSRRFIVAERACDLQAYVTKPIISSKSETHQQLNITVNVSRLNITDPLNEVKIYAVQNGNWESGAKKMQPDLAGAGEIKISGLTEKNLFPGGNEFRYFDLKSRRYKTEFVRDIVFENGIYQVFLFPSEEREFKPYFYYPDFNGRFIIANQEGFDANTDADYFNVFFTLPVVAGLEEGTVSIEGALTNRETGRGPLMDWNFKDNRYESTMLLKQGWYNYRYSYRSAKRILQRQMAI